MRFSKALGSFVAMAAACVAFSTAASADAPEYTVAGGAGSVEVKGAAGWHINKDGPWKVTVGTTILDKAKWTLGETSAKITGVPAGDATVKLYVCSGDKCKNAEVVVHVN